jgi:hypothetical protein
MSQPEATQPAPPSPRRWWQSIPARVGALTAIVVAIATLLNSVIDLPFWPWLQRQFSGPDIEEVIDRQFVTIASTSVWSSPDVTRSPVARLEPNLPVRVRGRIKQGRMYLIEQPSGGVGYVATGTVREISEWREQKRTADQKSDLEEPRPTVSEASPETWFPRGARLSAPWTADTAIWERPEITSRRVGTLTAGARLPFMAAQGGEVEIIAKLRGGEWYQVGLGGRQLGFVLGREATEVWPRRVRPPSPVGPAVNSWTTQSGKVTLVDARTHYDLYFDEICAVPACDILTVYTGTPSKDERLDSRYFRSEQIVGSWKKDQRFEAYVQVPKLLTSVPGLTLYSCLGGVGACRPTKIYPPS